MYQGNWTCSKCGGAITELPFEPRSNSGLTCRNCFLKEKDAPTDAPAPDTANDSAAPTDAPAAPSEKPNFTGDWQCSECGGSITELPFEPRNTSNLRCRDCFLKSRSAS